LLLHDPAEELLAPTIDFLLVGGSPARLRLARLSWSRLRLSAGNRGQSSFHGLDITTANGDNGRRLSAIVLLRIELLHQRFDLGKKRVGGANDQAIAACVDID
jgi:hypothetical protein